jgi:hypothetical protein
MGHSRHGAIAHVHEGLGREGGGGGFQGLIVSNVGILSASTLTNPGAET